jgi:hypothetical protein
MTDEIDDTELAAMRRQMWYRCMQHCREQGMTGAEAWKANRPGDERTAASAVADA